MVADQDASVAAAACAFWSTQLSPTPCVRLLALVQAVAHKSTWGDVGLRQQWQTAAAVLMIESLKQQQGYEERGRLFRSLDSRQQLQELQVLPLGGSQNDLGTPMFSQAAVRGALLRATLPSQQRGLPEGARGGGGLGGGLGATGTLRGGWGGPSLSMTLPSTQDAVLAGRGGGRGGYGGGGGYSGAGMGARRGPAVDTQLSLDTSITIRHAYGRKRSPYVAVVVCFLCAVFSGRNLNLLSCPNPLPHICML